jgi:hypothetical protein
MWKDNDEKRIVNYMGQARLVRERKRGTSRWDE